MKDAETKLRCLELRAQGKSLSTIADTVGVRRQTVANWLTQYAEEVQNLKAIELDALRETFWMSKQTRIERQKARLERITAELEKRGFSDVPPDKLLELEQKARDALEKEFSGGYIRSEEQLKAAKFTRMSPPKDDWLLGPIEICRQDYPSPANSECDTRLLIEPEKKEKRRKQPSPE